MPLDVPSFHRPRPARGPAFSAFLERDAHRERRRKSRRNTLIASLLLHGLAVAAVVIYSMWDVEELWGPAVKVKVYTPASAPPAASAPSAAARARLEQPSP